jgi:antitoxin (DNA-binding transcriptional repressor) of toxin-antitoxin stability system
MRTATVAELREKLDEVLDAVRSGEAVEIRDSRGRIARIEPAPEALDRQSRIEELIAAGVLYRPGSGKLPDDFFTRPLARFSSGSVVDDLLKEREEGW